MDSNFHSLYHTVYLFSGIRRFALTASLICLLVSAASCRSTSEMYRTSDTVVVNSTQVEYIHDTVQVTQIIRDSIDRYVEKAVYVDSSGAVKEKEKEYITKYVYIDNDKYKNTTYELRSIVDSLQSKLNEKETIIEAKKQPSFIQRTLMSLGVVFLIGLVSVLIYYGFRLRLRAKP